MACLETKDWIKLDAEELSPSGDSDLTKLGYDRKVSSNTDGKRSLKAVDGCLHSSRAIMTSEEVSDRRLQFSQPIVASVEAEDWREGLTLLQRQKYMLEGQYGADVKFLVGPDISQQTIMAHRFTLVSASEVFEELLRTRGRDAEDAIVITDVDPDAFREMLRFIYYEEINITADNAKALWDLSQQYSITQLVDECVAFLGNAITCDTVCAILVQSVQYNEEALAAQCVSFIAHHTSEVLESSDFVQISHRSLSEIIQSEEMKYIKETNILQACLRWADARCLMEDREMTDANRRVVLGDILFKVRFPLLTAVEFTQSTKDSSLLTSSERARIFDHITLHGSRPSECDCNIGFNTRHRGSASMLIGQLITVKRFRHSKWSGGYSMDSASIDLVCSRTASLEGVGLYGGAAGCNHDVIVQLFDAIGQILSDTGTINVISDGSKRPVRVDLSPSVLLAAEVRYTLVVKMSGQSAYYGRKGAVSVSANDLTVTFYNSPLSSKYTSVESGQIPELYFK